MSNISKGHDGLGELLPKLLTVWRKGYSLSDLKSDAFAGLTVAIVALPPSMAIAIASGVGPELGLFTAIVGGFLVSAQGGSRYQIGSPAGTFIVVGSACVTATGVQGLILATLLSGVILAPRRVRPHWPGMLNAVTMASMMVWALGLPVATIGTRFGDLPHLLPEPALPDLSLWRQVLPWAASFALLGAIESLLSAVVAWGMAERQEFAALLRSTRGDALVVRVTFLLVVFRDLTEGIVVGFALAGLVFIKRMSEGVAMRPREEHLDVPRADRVVYHLDGPYFFGAAAQLGGVLDRIAEAPRALVLEMSGVPLIDSSGALGFHRLAARAAKRGGQFYRVGLKPALRRQLQAQGLTEPEVRFLPDLAAVDATLDAQPGGESH